MTEIPILETERLFLRSPTVDDWPDFVALMRSDRSVFMGGPYTTDAAWRVFCHDVAAWQLVGHGALMLEDRTTGACLGQISINHGPLFPEHELGWFLYSAAEGKGYAFEAARTLRDWAFTVRGLKTLVSYMDPNNIRSRRLAERLGATLDETAVRADPTDLVFRYPGP